MCDEADCVAVATVYNIWLLLEDDHCNFTEILGRQYIRITTVDVSKSGASKYLQSINSDVWTLLILIQEW
jgi:hypothetical protein